MIAVGRGLLVQGHWNTAKIPTQYRIPGFLLPKAPPLPSWLRCRPRLHSDVHHTCRLETLSRPVQRRGSSYHRRSRVVDLVAAYRGTHAWDAGRFLTRPRETTRAAGSQPSLGRGRCRGRTGKATTGAASGRGEGGARRAPRRRGLAGRDAERRRDVLHGALPACAS
jgi:hypothetical protein